MGMFGLFAVLMVWAATLIQCSQALVRKSSKGDVNYNK